MYLYIVDHAQKKYAFARLTKKDNPSADQEGEPFEVQDQSLTLEEYVQYLEAARKQDKDQRIRLQEN